MTEEQFKRAVEIKDRLQALHEVKNAIDSMENHRLSYSYRKFDGDYALCAEYRMRPIAEILDKHDKMIREEIDEEIRKLQDEIKTL